MAVDAQGAMHDLIMKILGRHDVAQSVAADTGAAVNAAGLGDVQATMTVADFQAQVAVVCDELSDDISAEVHAALSAYSAGNPAPLAAPTSAGGGGTGAVAPALPQPAAASAPLTAQTISTELQYVTYVTYEGDETIINEIINQEITQIDNSVNLELEVDGDFEGDIVTATGGGVAAGDDVENAVTGDGSVLVDGDANAPIVTGDGAVLNQGTIEGGVATGAGAVATGQDSQNVIGDDNTTVQAGGNVEDVSQISGDVGGDAVSIGDFDDGSLAFGDGAQATNISDIDSQGGDVNIGQTVGDGVTNVDTSDTATAQGGGSAFAEIDDAAIGTGSGDVGNISDLDDGSAASLDGDATGSDINDAFNDNEGPVTVEQGAGDQEVELAVEEAPADPAEGVEA